MIKHLKYWSVGFLLLLRGIALMSLGLGVLTAFVIGIGKLFEWALDGHDRTFDVFMMFFGGLVFLFIFFVGSYETGKEYFEKKGTS